MAKIRLTEKYLHKVVNESVKKVLNESLLDYIGFSMKRLKEITGQDFDSAFPIVNKSCFVISLNDKFNVIGYPNGELLSDYWFDTVQEVQDFVASLPDSQNMTNGM